MFNLTVFLFKWSKSLQGVEGDVIVKNTYKFTGAVVDADTGLAVGFVGGMLANLGTTYASAFDSSVSVISGGFLGALFAGFVGGYLVLGLKKIFDKLPQALEGLKPT